MKLLRNGWYIYLSWLNLSYLVRASYCELARPVIGPIATKAINLSSTKVQSLDKRQDRTNIHSTIVRYTEHIRCNHMGYYYYGIHTSMRGLRKLRQV